MARGYQTKRVGLFGAMPAANELKA